MTLIIYKPGMLAADSRTTAPHSEKRDCKTCPKCNEETDGLVTDDSNKIMIVPKEKNYLFRGEQIKAVAGAGNKSTIDVVKKIIEEGGDIATTFNAFLKFNVGIPVRGASILLVGVKNTYRIRLHTGGMSVTSASLNKKIIMGSGRVVADTLELMAGGIMSPVDLIIHTKLIEFSVGGPVNYVNLDDEELKIVTVDESLPRTFDLEKIQKAIHDLVPKPVSPKPINRKRPLKRKVNV